MGDLSGFCCRNPECPDYGKRGAGNLSVSMWYGPEKKRRMLYCGTCKSRFSERKGTPLFDARLPEEKVPAPTRTAVREATVACLHDFKDVLHFELAPRWIPPK